MTKCPILETHACRLPPAPVQNTSVTELPLPEHLLRKERTKLLARTSHSAHASQGHSCCLQFADVETSSPAAPKLQSGHKPNLAPILPKAVIFLLRNLGSSHKSQLPRLLGYPAIGQLLHFLLHIHLTLPKLLAGSRETPSGASHVRIGDLKEDACATIW